MCIEITTAYPGRFAVANEDYEYCYTDFIFNFFRDACKLDDPRIVR